MLSSIPSLLNRSFPAAVPSPDQELDTDALSKLPIFPSIHYTDAEKAEIHAWLVTAVQLASPSEDEAKAAEKLSALNTHLSSRTTVLGGKPSVADVVICGRLAPVVAKWDAEQRTGEAGYHHVVRHLDFVQNASVFGLKLEEGEKVGIDADKVVAAVKPKDLKAERERKKKDKEALAAATGNTPSSSVPSTAVDQSDSADAGNRQGKKEKAKDLAHSMGSAVAKAVGVADTDSGAAVGRRKEKKEKPPKQAKPTTTPVKDKPLSPALIDLRVGHIIKAEAHPNADSLYVSTIAVGDAPGADNTSDFEGQVVRTVCSGLNGLIPLADMQGRKVVCVCNLKPVTMRGIKSAAMVLAASPREEPGAESGGGHKGPVELVDPPEGAKAGQRVYFEGFEGEPEGVLNPKKKVWETFQVGFTTTEDKVVGFEPSKVPQIAGESSAEGSTRVQGVAKLRTTDGMCTVPSLKGATVR